MRLLVLLLLVAQFSAPVQSLANTPSLLISPLLQLGMCRNFVLLICAGTLIVHDHVQAQSLVPRE